MRKKKAGRPVYLEIEAYLRRLIDAGEGRSAPLPTEADLAERFDVSRMTARQAFNRLVNTGIVIRFRKRGSFANQPLLMEVPLSGEAVSLGDERGGTKDVTRYELRKAPAQIARRFDLKPGTLLTFLEQIRFLDLQPLAIDRRYMPAAVYRRISYEEMQAGNLLTLLPKHRFFLSNATIEVRAGLASSEFASILEIERGTPVLERDVSLYGIDERLTICGVSVYPAERYAYRVRVGNLNQSAAARNRVMVAS